MNACEGTDTQNGAGVVTDAAELIDPKAMRQGFGDWYERKTQRAINKAERDYKGAFQNYAEALEAEYEVLMRNSERFARAHEALNEANRTPDGRSSHDESSDANSRIWSAACTEAVSICQKGERVRGEFKRVHDKVEWATYRLCHAQGALDHAREEANNARDKAYRGFKSAMKHAKSEHARK